MDPVWGVEHGVMAEIRIMDGAETNKDSRGWIIIESGEVEIKRLLNIDSEEFSLSEIKSVLVDLSARESELSDEAAEEAVDAGREDDFPWFEHFLFEDGTTAAQAALGFHIDKYGTDGLLETFSKHELRELASGAHLRERNQSRIYKFIKKNKEDYLFFVTSSYNKYVLCDALLHLNYKEIKIAEKKRTEHMKGGTIWFDKSEGIIIYIKMLVYKLFNRGPFSL